MKDPLLQKPYSEKLFEKQDGEPDGKLIFEDPERESDGEFLGRSARINDEELEKYIEAKKDQPIIISRPPKDHR